MDRTPGSRAARRAAALLAGVLMAGSLATAGASSAADDPADLPPRQQRAFAMVVTDDCTFIDADGTQRSFPATVRTDGTVPVRMPILTPFDVTITSVTVTSDAVAVEPRSVGYFIRNEITQSGSSAGTYSFTDPAPQYLSFTAGVNSPFTLAREVSLDLSITPPGAPAAEAVSCYLEERPGPGIEVPLDLPADGSLRPFDLRNTGLCGSQRSPIGFRLTGVVSPSVAPGGQARIIAEHGGARGDLGQDQVTLSVTGTTGENTLTYQLPGGSEPVELTLPPAGQGEAVRVRFASATGLTHVMDPATGRITLSNYNCSFPEAGDPLVIPITGGSGTTTTTAPPEHPLCRYRGSVPAWFWQFLVSVLRITCPGGGA